MNTIELIWAVARPTARQWILARKFRSELPQAVATEIAHVWSRK